MKREPTIIAIGGGDPRTPGAFPRRSLSTIDLEIVKRTGKKNPKLLFIPTATKDWEGYVEAVKQYFGKKGGCTIDVLRLVKERLTHDTIKKKIADADIIYVGGGNTLFMMKKWRKLGVDSLLRKAWQSGTVMCGLSAGAICWFQHGTSDSRMLTDPTYKDYIRVRGLGWFDVTMSPHHYTEKKRKAAIIKMIKKYGGIGIALDDCAAIEIVGKRCRILRSASFAKAYKVTKRGNEVAYEEIETEKYIDLKLLLR